MALRIRSLDPGFAPAAMDRSVGSSAFDLDSTADVVLRFAIEASDSHELEALRRARRSMLREELTRGLEEEEPSLEDAVFSPAGISWRARLEQRFWCLQKVEQLASRAHRGLAEVRSV